MSGGEGFPGPPGVAGGAEAGTAGVVAGRYELRRLLGRGGMAEVYEGTDLRLARPVALKVLHPQLAADPGFRARFESEARAAARLSHPHVVAVYDTGEDAGRPWIVMERLPGRTLADDIAEGPLGQDQVRRVALEVLDALGAAHAAGLIHRDVKAANILWDADGGVKVADFGIAKGVEPLGGAADLTGTNLLVGTPSYLAPERVDGDPATVRSDLWSLGVVLYEALTGRRPFAGGTPVALAMAIRDGDRPPLLEQRPDLDPGLARVVERALAMAPTDRFGSAGEMARALGGGGGGWGPAAATTLLGGNGGTSPAEGPTAVWGADPGATPTPAEGTPTSALGDPAGTTAHLEEGTPTTSLATSGSTTEAAPPERGRHRRPRRGLTRAGWVRLGVILVLLLAAAVAAVAVASLLSARSRHPLPPPPPRTTTTAPPRTTTTAPPRTTTTAAPTTTAPPRTTTTAPPRTTTTTAPTTTSVSVSGAPGHGGGSSP